MEKFNNLDELYEDEESKKMMKIINNQQVKTYKEYLKQQEKEEKSQNIRNILCLVGCIGLFAFVMVWAILLNIKLDKKDMENCLKNNNQEYCNQTVAWGAE